LGGVIDAVAIQHFVEWYHWASLQLTTTQIVPLFILYGAILFLIPLAFSWLFNRIQPEMRIVPPLFMQLVAAGLLLFFLYSSLVTGMEYFGILFYAIYAGLVQDGVVLYSVGKNVLSDDIIMYSFLLHSDINKVQEIVRSKQFRTLFGYNKVVKKTSLNPNMKFRSTRGRNYEVILELKTTGRENETILNLAFYQEQRYEIKHIEKTDDIYEFAELRSENIPKYLTRHYSIQVDNVSKDNADSLVEYILDDLQGALTRFQAMTTENRVLIGVTIALSIIGTGLCIFVNLEWGILILLTALGLGADIINRSRG
jgi:hypothetical protein